MFFHYKTYLWDQSIPKIVSCNVEDEITETEVRDSSTSRRHTRVNGLAASLSSVIVKPDD